MATGFVLNIDEKLLKNLALADELVQDIGKHSEQTEKLFNTAFAKMTTGSLDDFIRKLLEARHAIQDIGNAQASGNGLGRISTQAVQGADSVTTLVEAITRLMQVAQGREKVQPVDINSINIAEDTIDSLREKIATLKRLLSQNRQGLIDETQQQNAKLLLDEINRLQVAYGNLRAEQKNLQSFDKVFSLSEETISQTERKLAKMRELWSNLYKDPQKYEEELKKVTAEIQRLIKRKSDLKKLTTFEGAMDFSKSTKSIKDQIQAIKYLKAARENLSKEGMSEAVYRKKVKELTDEIKRQQKEVDKLVGKNSDLGKSHKSLINTADQLKRAFALMFSVSAIKGYVTQIARVRGEFELQQRSLQAILQNKDEADRLWQQTIQLAVRSPFQVKELVTYTKQLAAYRVESDKLYDTTKMLADVSAGLGVDMNRLILAYGQVKAANYLRGTELRQFSEAGVNILAELAKYFTEVEGRAVSVGEVFERVSKRMVTFADVEEIFKRITSEGGIFYNMQEIQAETLKGQISNLRDAIDIMLNDIGKSNEGVLKTVVGLIKTLIENWSGLSAILEPVFFIAIASSVVKFGKGISLVGDALLEATISGKGFLAMGAKIKTMTMQLWATIAANPILALIAVVASLVVGLVKYNNAVKEANKEYDDLSQRELRRTKNLEDYTKKINENNNAIEKNTNNETELKKARAANDELLSKIKKEYPELYQSITQQTNGIVDMTKAIENQNKQMRINIALQQNAKGGWFQDTLSENYKDALEAQKKLSSIIVQIQSFAAQQQIKLTNAFNEGKITNTQYEKLNSVLKQTVDADDYYELANALQNIENLDFGGVSRSAKKLFRAFDDLKTLLTGVGRGGLNSALNDLYDNLDNQMFAFQAGVADIVALNPEKGAEKAGEWVDSQLVALGIVDKEIKKFAREYVASKIVGVKLSFVDAKDDKIYTEQDLTQEWQKKLWNAIKDIEKANPEIRVGVSLKELATGDKTSIINDLRKTVPELQKIFGEIAKLNPKSDQLWQSPEQIKQAKNAIRPLQKLAELLALINKERGKDTEKEKITAQISLIKEMNKEYEKLRKEYSEIDALDRIRKSFTGTAESVGLDISESLFDDKGTKSSLEKLLSQVPEKLRPLVQKALDNVEVDIEFTAKDEQNKKLKQEVEDLFSQYDLSRELEKLGLSKELMKSLFDVEYLDLRGLKENVINEFSGTSEALKSELQKGFGNIDWLTVNNLSSGELMEVIKKALKDIDDLEDKQQLESAKRFAKFLTQNLDQTKVVIQQRVIDIAFAKKEFDEGRISVEQFAEVVENIVAQSNEEISKFNLEKFKETPEYIQAMGDLASYSKNEIQELIKTLNDAVTQNAHLFDADKVKAYMDALKKAQEELESRDIFKWGDFGRAADIIQTQKEIEDKKADIETNKAELETQKKKLAELQEKLRILKEQQKTTQKAGGDTTQVDVDIKKTTSDIVTANEEIGKAQNKIKTNTGLLSLLGDKMKGIAGNMGTTLAIIDAIVHGINDTVQGINTIYGEIGSVMESFGKETDFSTGFGKGAMLMDTFAKSSQAAADGWDAFKNGDPVGVVVNVVKSITEIIKGITAYHDAGLEVLIQDHLKEVERLQKEYEKLEWAIDRAFSFKKYGMVAEQQENLSKQIENTQKAIAAEEDKKDTDKKRIEELQGEIEEASKQIQELYDNLREDIVGTFKDLSSTLGDAMISALQQGEDALKAWSDSVNDIITDIVGQLLIQKYLEPQIANLVNDYYSKIMPKNARAENKYQEYLKAIERGDSATAEKLIEEYKKLAEQAIGEVPQINEDATKQFQSDLLTAGENFKDLIPDWLINSTKEDSGLSALQKGIQGITESQAEIISAYLNSLRFFVADNNSVMKQLRDYVIGTDDTVNPMLAQLRIVAQQTTAINSLLSSLTKGGHTEGGLGLKVFIN